MLLERRVPGYCAWCNCSHVCCPPPSPRRNAPAGNLSRTANAEIRSAISKTVPAGFLRRYTRRACTHRICESRPFPTVRVDVLCRDLCFVPACCAGWRLHGGHHWPITIAASLAVAVAWPTESARPPRMQILCATRAHFRRRLPLLRHSRRLRGLPATVLQGRHIMMGAYG